MKIKKALAAGAAGFVLFGAGSAIADVDGLPGALNGTLAPTLAANDGVLLATKANTEVSTLDKIYQPGDVSGWHEHKGVVLATVESGSVERLVLKKNGRCVRETFAVGDSFTEVEAHNVRNTGAVPAVLSLTILHPEDVPFTSTIAPPANRSCQF